MQRSEANLIAKAMTNEAYKLLEASKHKEAFEKYKLASSAWINLLNPADPKEALLEIISCLHEMTNLAVILKDNDTALNTITLAHEFELTYSHLHLSTIPKTHLLRGKILELMNLDLEATEDYIRACNIPGKSQKDLEDAQNAIAWMIQKQNLKFDYNWQTAPTKLPAKAILNSYDLFTQLPLDSDHLNDNARYHLAKLAYKVSSYNYTIQSHVNTKTLVSACEILTDTDKAWACNLLAAVFLRENNASKAQKYINLVQQEFAEYPLIMKYALSLKNESLQEKTPSCTVFGETAFNERMRLTQVEASKVDNTPRNPEPGCSIKPS